jgi:hypothetical protein
VRDVEADERREHACADSDPALRHEPRLQRGGGADSR